MYPIKRQFKITLAPADKMYLRTADGNGVSLKEVQPQAYISNKMSKSLGIDDADTDTLAYRTSGEKLTITVENSNYFTFKGLVAVNSNNPKDVIEIASANGDKSCTFTLDNELLKKLICRGNADKWDFVTLTNRSGGGRYGNFTIKPVFEYKDRKVYVEKNTQYENKVSAETYNSFGVLSVNGKEYELSDDEFRVEIKPDDKLGNTYHYGDEFVVKTNAKHTDIASAAGVGYRTGINIDTMDKTRTDKKNAEATYTFTRNSDILKNNVVAFYPIYTEKQNGLTLMVKKSDIDNGIIDTSYGIVSKFTDASIDKIIDYREENGEKVAYYRFVASKDVNTDTYYQYSARALDGYAIKWYNDTTKITYSGNNLFYKPMGLSQDENILIISAETGKNVINARFKGSANYKVLDVSTGLASDYYMPLKNAAITFGGTGSMTDDNGEFETGEAGQYIVGTHVIERVAVDNSFNYVDYTVSISNKKVAVPNEETYTVQNVGEVPTVKTTPYTKELWRRVDNLEDIPDQYRTDSIDAWVNDIAFQYLYKNDIEKTDIPKSTGDFFNIHHIYFYPVTVTCYKTETITESKVVPQTRTGTVYTINTGNYTAQVTNNCAEILDVNVFEGDSTYSRNGVIDINDSIYTFRADVKEVSDEHIKELKFLVVEPDTKKVKYTINAQRESSSGQWVAVEKMDIAMKATYTSGDTLYAVITTDKNIPDAASALKEYLPVYTGYDFIQGDSAYDSYEPQNFNLPTNGSFGSLPVLDKLATGFDFPYVSISLEQLPTGEYRVKLGADIADIIDKFADTNLGGEKDISGMGYTKDIDWKHPINELKTRAGYAFDSIFKKGLKNSPLFADGSKTKLGPNQFSFSLMIGGYIDFGKIETTYNGAKYSEFAVTGGGGYLGVSVSFKKAFYFLICGTVPAYIGGSASGTLIGNMGATRKSNTVLTLNSMKDKQLEIDDALAFNGNLNVSASVSLYAGVGLCDVLGVRLVGDTDLSLLWEPLAKQTYAMNDEVDEIVDNDYSNAKIHEVGFTVAFSLGGKVDLLLFSIPIMYHFNPINTGFNKDIANAHVRKTSSSTVDVNGSTKETDITGHISEGWYYIRNVYNNKYLQVKNSSVDMIGKSAEENPNMRFYISVEKDKTVTIKAQEGYTDSKAKYLMIYEDANATDGFNFKLKSSDLLSDSEVKGPHKFIIREPNIGDFNIISATQGQEEYLMLGSSDKLIFDKTGTDNSQLWRLEPVDEPIENGVYKIKNTTLNKYMANSNGKAQLEDSKDSNSQKWNVKVTDNYISLQNLADSSKYLYVDSDSSSNGVSISVKEKDDTDAIYFDTTKLIDGTYYITTKYGLGNKYLSVNSSNSDIISNSFNDTLNQIWAFEKADNTVVNGGTNSVEPVMLSAEGVSLFSANDNYEEVSEINYSDENSYDDESVYLRKRTTGDSQWVASSNRGMLRSGFKPTNETTLITNSYERPDSQVLDLGNGDYILVFIDTDSSRGELERNVLKFAVYRNGIWSEPKVIQEDGTADFQPSLTDAGENIALTWISSDPNAEKTGNPSQYLTTMEVYTTLINKATGEVGEITRLTKDNFYDYSPTVVYDSTTGDMAVYYIKTTMNSSFLETANSFTNDCFITYMLYDSNMGKWLTDYYYPEEVFDPDTAEELIKNWGGQRFLPSPIDELNMNDPLITDFTAISYNGLAVYGYTIDKDKDSSTNEDRDLFIQVYDFTTHKNHYPIRITDDDFADSMPQFVRQGYGLSGNTYLYWFRGDNKLSYINVSEMAHNGLNDDGTISDPDLIAPRDVYINLPPEMKQGSNDAHASMSYYRVCVDKDENIYVIWVDLDRETNIQEIFATAVITDSETGETSYADAYQLTHSGKHNDEPAFLVDDSGNMVVISTRYNSSLTDDPVNPLEITDTELVATVFEPYGELYAEDITLSDITPNVGDTVNVTAKLHNRGLTVAKGYKAEIYEMKDNEIIRVLDTINSEDYINAGSYAEFSYDWTISDNIEGVSLGINVTEGNMRNSSMSNSDPLKLTPDISLDGVGITQKDDGFYLHAVAKNNGNVATDNNDNINVVYYPDKAPAKMLGIEDETFAKVSLGAVEAGESKEIDIRIDNVKGEMFNAYGYLPILVAVTDDDGNIISNDEVNYIIMEKPIDLKVNNTNQIVINVGESTTLQMSYAPSERYNDVTPLFYTEDVGTASVVGNELVGVSQGSTTLIAKAEPYGSVTEVEVIVNGVDNPTTDETTTTEETTETTTTTTYRSGGGGSGGVKVTTTEATTEITTEAQIETTTENQVINSENTDRFIDISNHWAKDIINEISDKNIVSGYEDNTFRPNNSITRAEFLTILYNSNLVSKEIKNTEISFMDITGNEWYYDYVKWGVENNLILGYIDDTFRGDNIITRQEMAVVISKFIDIADINIEKGEAVEFNDADTIAPWAMEYVENLSAYGIIKGDNNGNYLPNKDLTRAETAVIINRLLN
ncbi:MAG: S-layer homology domain-containing protein [Lachnospirales bacterium]